MEIIIGSDKSENDNAVIASFGFYNTPLSQATPKIYVLNLCEVPQASDAVCSEGGKCKSLSLSCFI